MSDEWGPWIGRTLGQEMSHIDPFTVIDWLDADGNTCSGEDGHGTTAAGINWDAEWSPVVAYRVKKEPVVEVVEKTVSMRGDLYTYYYRAQCTYTDGKLTKIYWEADQ